MNIAARILALSLVVFASGLSSDARAQEPLPESRSAEFQAVEGGAEEEISGLGMMVGAYALIGLVLLGYVVRIARLQAGTSAELERLARELGEGDGAGGAGAS